MTSKKSKINCLGYKYGDMALGLSYEEAVAMGGLQARSQGCIAGSKEYREFWEGFMDRWKGFKEKEWKERYKKELKGKRRCDFIVGEGLLLVIGGEYECEHLTLVVSDTGRSKYLCDYNIGEEGPPFTTCPFDE